MTHIVHLKKIGINTYSLNNELIHLKINKSFSKGVIWRQTKELKQFKKKF